MFILFVIFVVVFVAQSLTEYKMVTNIPWFERNFYGWRASAISATISVVMGATAGMTMGKAYTLPFILAGVVGASTNEVTFNFWSWYYKTKGFVQRKSADWKRLNETRPQFIQDVSSGGSAILRLIVMIAAGIGKLIRFIGWLASVPERIQSRFTRS